MDTHQNVSGLPQCVLGLVCSAWKRVLHAPAFHRGCLIIPWCTDGWDRAATLFHPPLDPFLELWCPSVFNSTFGWDGVYFLMVLPWGHGNTCLRRSSKTSEKVGLDKEGCILNKITAKMLFSFFVYVNLRRALNFSGCVCSACVCVHTLPQEMPVELHYAPLVQ